MYWLASLGLILGVLFSAIAVSADLPQAYYTPSQSDCRNPAQPCGTRDKKITFYVPHSAPGCKTSIEGCIETALPGLNGKAVPVPVDAILLGKAKYATCASDRSNYGKYFNIGTVTYRSADDQQMHTVQNVICFVHDTGGAFRGRPDKLDLATTLCPSCSDAQAGAIGRGAVVNVSGGGPLDVNGSAAIFDAALDNMSPANTGRPAPPFRYSQAAPPMSQPISQLAVRTPLGQQLSQSLFGNQSTSTPFVNPQALLIAQPASVKLGNPILVSWSSVGMSAQTACQVSENGQSLAQTNTGSQIVQTKSLQTGTLAFTLSCTTQAGMQLQQSTSVSII